MAKGSAVSGQYNNKSMKVVGWLAIVIIPLILILMARSANKEWKSYISAAIYVGVIYPVTNWIEKKYFDKANIVLKFLAGALTIGVLGLIIWAILKYTLGLSLRDLLY